MSDELEQDLETAPIVPDDNEFDEAEDPLAEPTDKDGNFIYGKPDVLEPVDAEDAAHQHRHDVIAAATPLVLTPDPPRYRVRYLPSHGANRTLRDDIHDLVEAIKFARAWLITEDVSRYDRVQVTICKLGGIDGYKWYARWTGCRFGSEIICVHGENRLDITMCEAVLINPQGEIVVRHETSEPKQIPITFAEPKSTPLNTSTYPGSGPTTPLFPNAMTDEQWAALGIDAQRKAVDAECARDHESPFKIPRIKALRRLTAWGLKEAKDWVDANLV